MRVPLTFYFTVAVADRAIPCAAPAQRTVVLIHVFLISIFMVVHKDVVVQIRRLRAKDVVRLEDELPDGLGFIEVKGLVFRSRSRTRR